MFGDIFFILYNVCMSWFNYYGLIFIAVIMIPNVIYAIKNKDSFENIYKNKFVIILEQIGRYACLLFMIFNIPYTYFNFWFENALLVYLIVNIVLCVAYLVFWAICWKRKDKLKAVSLSVLPTCIFIFSGVILLNIPLIVFSIIFGITHVLLSCKNIEE